MNTSNLKSTLSTIFGILAVICGAIVTASQSGLHLPTWLITICTALAGISVAVIGWLTGKNPDGTTKTPTQVNALNTEAANTQPPKI